MFTPTCRNQSRNSFGGTPQTGRSQNRRISNVFSQRKRQSLNVSTASSRTQGSFRLQTSQILEETAGHKIERYGPTLPVLITETLSLTSRQPEMSVKIDPSGWAWLVGGRRLFIWRYKQLQTSRSVFCKELTLPPSDLAHNADRVCVISNAHDRHSASCVAVSPEGIVRYWPNVAYEGMSTEISAELRGEESACIVNYYPFGVLLATTTSSLLLLTTSPGQNTLVCHPLKASQGMFAGLGRRMSSFIFGASPLHPTGAPLLALAPGDDEEDDQRPFYVLSGTQLQKWTICDGTIEKLFYQLEVDRLFRDALARKVWGQEAIQMPNLKSWLIDMKATREGVMILAAGANLEASQTLHFAIIVIDTVKNEVPYSLKSVQVLDFTLPYEGDVEHTVQSLNLLVPDSMGQTVFVFDKTRILVIADEGKVTDFQAPGGRILGAGPSDNMGVFFSGQEGMFTVSPVRQDPYQNLLDDSVMEASRLEMTPLNASQAQIQELSMCEDKVSKLKGAFLSSMKGNMDMAQRVVNEMFGADVPNDGSLEQTVVSLSQDLIDDYSAADPRWAENRPDSCSSTASLIILNQLSDKLKAHEYVITFLKKVGLWTRLGTVFAHDRLMSAHDVLCEHAEKICAAMAIRQAHSEYGGVIDAAITKVLDKRGDTYVIQGLSPHDVFFREVSKVHEIIQCLYEYEEEILSTDLTISELFTAVTSVNAVFETMLQKALAYRHTKRNVYFEHVQEEAHRTVEFIPWSTGIGERGVRSILLKQFSLTHEKILPEASNQSTEDLLFQQMAALADIVLDDFVTQIDSIRHDNQQAEHLRDLEKKYHQYRQQLIIPLLERGYSELAASLAEKYNNFEILVKLCEESDNAERIERYLTQFADKGFAEFLYGWYMKEGKRGKLLALPAHLHEELGRFLQMDDTKYLSWIHQIQTNDFDQAYDSLLDLARGEVESVAKKKTLLSLGKLAALASSEPVENFNIVGIDEELDLITHQEQLPEHIKQQVGYDGDNMQVLSPVQLIQLYLDDPNSTEYNYKKAIDLLQYLDQNDPSINFEELRLQVWSRAILRDSWSWDQYPSPQDFLQDTVLYKVVLLAVSEGTDVQSFLPSLEDVISCPELGILKEDKNFQYLIRLFYENFLNVMTG